MLSAKLVTAAADQSSRCVGRSRRAPALTAAACLALLACTPGPGAASPSSGVIGATPPSGGAGGVSADQGLRYDDPRSWLCLPDRADPCSAPLDMTELRADGTRAIERDAPAPGRDRVDCFYVYPTVDMSLTPANHTAFDDLRPMEAVTLSQAARLRNVCRLFVPLYRQSTIGAYLAGNARRGPYRETAARDVVAAFEQYMRAYNGGRKVAIIGHSQGGEMVVVLLRRLFDHDAAMRDKLLIAMSVGWPLFVAAGKTTGGTFENVPVCTREGETGCVIGYRSFDARSPSPAGTAMPLAGYESVCVPPSMLAHGTTVMSRSVFGVPGAYGMARLLHPLYATDSVTTPFVEVCGAYDGTCVSADGGYKFLAVRERAAAGSPGAPAPPIDLGTAALHTALGLHAIDMELEAGDLVDLVGQRMERMERIERMAAAQAPAQAGEAPRAEGLEPAR